MVRPLDPLALRLAGHDDPIERAVLDRVVKDVGPGIDRCPRLAAIIGIAGIGLASGIIATRTGLALARSGTVPVGELVRLLPVLVGVVSGLALHCLMARNVRVGRVCSVPLAHRRCPHCGYALEGLPADGTAGLTTCPECGCRWRLDAPTVPG
ncbi:MAG: hypothetical protein ACYTJ0_02205 [Planctomycetota bacterium]